jgi:hypothetical protein
MNILSSHITLLNNSGGIWISINIVVRLPFGGEFKPLDASALGNADAKLREFPRVRRDLKTIPEASEREGVERCQEHGARDLLSTKLFAKNQTHLTITRHIFHQPQSCSLAVAHDTIITAKVVKECPYSVMPECVTIQV